MNRRYTIIFSASVVIVLIAGSILHQIFEYTPALNKVQLNEVRFHPYWLFGLAIGLFALYFLAKTVNEVRILRKRNKRINRFK